MPQLIYPKQTYHLIITHIMWYEIELVQEYLASLTQALSKAKWPIHLDFLINAQTYLETPDENSNALELAQQIQTMILTHPFNIWNPTKIIHTNIKKDDDPFYNIGDYRRDIVNTEIGYTIWGEVDSLYPENYFQLLEIIATEKFEDPYIVSFASRKCWDDTWTVVEHSQFQPLPPSRKDEKKIVSPFNWDDYITQQELDEFNNKQTKNPPLIMLHELKFDGSLLAFSSGMPQFIPDDMHFAREDWCAQLTLHYVYPHIKQYHLPTVLKGHNYNHALKRMHTNSSRDDTAYKLAEQDSVLAAKRWLSNLGIEFHPRGPALQVIRYNPIKV